MKIELSDKTKSDLTFLDNLSLTGAIDWPIDYEINRQSLAETSETMDLWMGGSKWRETDYFFIQFGQDGTGSLFCLWFYPDLAGEPPVVFLGSEGERVLVSNNVNDFIRQLASGKVFFDGSWLDPDEEEKDELDWTALAEKVISYTGANPTAPSELSKLAASNHPDISAWIENNIE